ncbi:putative zinc metalloproteasec [Hartmannibacter diazotrophicus]|uniref:Zinc metalloprotease n=1 Tax=Hartmannibacter diazotrophicus TaxID=1482074 RepID=A0A2C9DC83_9HYPH|nr:site-2 protease family protein [Hartmannibacter diazotrophicus]SON57331.1 putative zinc metalloproteasec [Hartmannibacter diazotrophicus]
MSWSIPLGRVFGSEIRIHLTFLILLAWIGAAGYATGGASVALDSVVFVVAVFACVTLHELGHAVAARRYGITTPDITLLPIGGLARLSKLPEKPSEEIVIAIAGPMVNVVIAAFLYLFGAHTDPATINDFASTNLTFADRLMAVNIILVLFNLIPAFPMDGGRVLRAVLALKLGRRKATELAATIGQGLAFVFGAVGLFTGNAILVFIAIFVFLAATSEAGQVGLMERARKLRVADAMISRFESLPTNATVDMAADALLATPQREFPVVDGSGRLRGFLTRDAMISAMKSSGPATPVIDVMMREVPIVLSSQKLEVAIRLMQEKGAPFLGVNGADERLAGYLSQENISELMMLDAADWHGGKAAEAGPWSRA